METKEFKIEAPKGYEIDKENSTVECAKFKPKPKSKDITYKDVCNKIFKKPNGYFITGYGEIDSFYFEPDTFAPNSATNSKQLEKLLALNQLLNIAECYNKLHPTRYIRPYCITFEEEYGYIVRQYDIADCLYGVVALFNSNEDAQAVIDNPNFRSILDTLCK